LPATNPLPLALQEQATMSAETGISRRQVLSLAIAAGGLVMAGGARVASAQASGRTPDQISGRFYPVAKPLYQGAI